MTTQGANGSERIEQGLLKRDSANKAPLDAMREACHEERLALAGRRDSHAAIIGPGSRSSDRRVSDTSRNLAEPATGGCRRGEVAGLVEGDRADVPLARRAPRPRR